MCSNFDFVLFFQFSVKKFAINDNSITIKFRSAKTLEYTEDTIEIEFAKNNINQGDILVINQQEIDLWKLMTKEVTNRSIFESLDDPKLDNHWKEVITRAIKSLFHETFMKDPRSDRCYHGNPKDPFGRMENDAISKELEKSQENVGCAIRLENCNFLLTGDENDEYEDKLIYSRSKILERVKPLLEKFDFEDTRLGNYVSFVLIPEAIIFFMMKKLGIKRDIAMIIYRYTETTIGQTYLMNLEREEGKEIHKCTRGPHCSAYQLMTKSQLEKHNEAIHFCKKCETSFDDLTSHRLNVHPPKLNVHTSDCEIPNFE